MSKYIKCPKCRCSDLYVLEDNRNDFGSVINVNLNKWEDIYRCG